MRYYFYNPDSAPDVAMLQSLPDDVTAVPMGWSDEIEASRDALLRDLGVAVSGPPCVLYEVPASTRTETDSETGEKVEVTIPAHWSELRIVDHRLQQDSDGRAVVTERVLAPDAAGRLRLEASQRDAGGRLLLPDWGQVTDEIETRRTSLVSDTPPPEGGRD